MILSFSPACLTSWLIDDGVSADEMKLSGEINPLNTLYGLIPGLGVYHNGSLPYNSTPDIYVRGMASNQGNKVLVLVDGVEREIGSLNVDEIESVTVLKVFPAST